METIRATRFELIVGRNFGGTWSLSGTEIPAQWFNAAIDDAMARISDIELCRDEDDTPVLINGASQLRGLGVWQGTKERNALISVIVPSEFSHTVANALADIALRLKRGLWQDSVMLTCQELSLIFL